MRRKRHNRWAICFGRLLRVGYGASPAYEPLRKGSPESRSGKGFEEPGLMEESVKVLNWRRQGGEEVESKKKLKEDGFESSDSEMDPNYPTRKSKRADADLTGYEETEGSEENDIDIVLFYD